MLWRYDGPTRHVCSIIGAKVLNVGADNKEVTLYSENGAAVSLSLRNEDDTGPEGIQFTGEGGNWWVI